MELILLNDSTLLRINVGFVVNEAIGYSREISLEIPEFEFSEDLVVRNLIGKIIVSRTTEGILVQVKGQAQSASECVYCLDGFENILQLDFVEMYTFPSQVVEDTELILPDDQQINLAPLIGEYLHLDIPINPVCRPNCKGLCPICGGNLNNSSCNHEDEQVDPRLSVLKTLLDDDTLAAQ